MYATFFRECHSTMQGLALTIALALTIGTPSSSRAADDQDIEIALSLAQFLRSARTVISSNQDLINDPDIGDKGLDGKSVLDAAIEKYQDSTGTDPRSVDPESPEGRLLSAQMAAIESVLDENQATINKQGLGFKGFVPAVFARLVNEKFRTSVGQYADVKVTAPTNLVRNRKALPDEWENEVIESELINPDWPKDKIYTGEIPNNGRDAFRVLIPEYYGEGCLDCHGEPKGEIDVTGYPKEGGKLGDLGGVISITLFR
jgi:Protein of unknown function (DUF3365)